MKKTEFNKMMKESFGDKVINIPSETSKTKDLKVLGVRYFNTRRGLGYECKTNKLNVVIWNDGQGGGTFIAPYYPYTKDYQDIMENESDLEDLINEFEGVVTENN